MYRKGFKKKHHHFAVVLCTILLVFSLISCSNKEDTIHFHGTSAVNFEKLYLSLMLPEERVVVDSSAVKNGHFSFAYLLEEHAPNNPCFFIIHTKEESVTTIAKKGETIEITLLEEQFSKNYNTTGSNDVLLMYQLDTTLQLLDKSVKKLEQRYHADRYNDSLKIEIEEKYLALISKHQEYLLQFIHDNPSSLTTIPAFYQRYGRRIFFPEKEHQELLSTIIQNLKQHYPESHDLLFIERRTHKNL